jgi:hypothetical protein
MKVLTNPLSNSYFSGCENVLAGSHQSVLGCPKVLVLSHSLKVAGVTKSLDGSMACPFPAIATVRFSTHRLRDRPLVFATKSRLVKAGGTEFVLARDRVPNELTGTKTLPCRTLATLHLLRTARLVAADSCVRREPRGPGPCFQRCALLNARLRLLAVLSVVLLCHDSA